MKSPDLELDHIGIAVPELDASAPFWRALGWEGDPPRERVVDQKVEVAFLPVKNNLNLELLKPTDSSSTVAKFLDKRGPGIHHICFRVSDIDSLLVKLKAKGIKLINETPVAGAHQCRVAFVHPSSTGGILVELSEKAVK